MEPAACSSPILQITVSFGRLAGGDFSSTAAFNWMHTNMAIFYVMKQRGNRFYVMMEGFPWCEGDLQRKGVMLWFYLEFQREEMWQHYSNKLSFVHVPDITNFPMSQFGYRVRTRVCAFFLVTPCISNNKYFITQLMHSITWIIRFLKTLNICGSVHHA